ncbi:hypothetical protein QBC36DRAFT_310446 [Triangularia setosa]|uniref:Secreted protein n=1 Tax=Triangularia setosa TaxID=2587417 RepID=A0AAN6W8W0_9PEZI|nr:hypothetical protein QBC36DRAFT_310446 [Podospora setosa]
MVWCLLLGALQGACLGLCGCRACMTNLVWSPSVYHQDLVSSSWIRQIAVAMALWCDGQDGRYDVTCQNKTRRDIFVSSHLPDGMGALNTFQTRLSEVALKLLNAWTRRRVSITRTTFPVWNWLLTLFEQRKRRDLARPPLFGEPPVVSSCCSLALSSQISDHVAYWVPSPPGHCASDQHLKLRALILPDARPEPDALESRCASNQWQSCRLRQSSSLSHLIADQQGFAEAFWRCRCRYGTDSLLKLGCHPDTGRKIL